MKQQWRLKGVFVTGRRAAEVLPQRERDAQGCQALDQSRRVAAVGNALDQRWLTAVGDDTHRSR